MTVLSVAHPLATVSRDAPGGAEQILAMIDEALVRAGHRSVVIAWEGSRCRGDLLATPVISGALDDQARRRSHRATRAAIHDALDAFDIDVVHLHGLDFDQYLPPKGVPTLVTLHLPISSYAPGALGPLRSDVHFVCVSHSQRAWFPPPSRAVLVPNGVVLDGPGPSGSERRFAVWLGSICPEKAPHLAIDAATRAGIPIVLAGVLLDQPEHRDYFQREVKPRLGGLREYVGPVGFESKRALLASARCLLVPSMAAETLLAMEALACGTPVIAYPSGALAEVVENGRTGILVDSVDGMAGAIGAVETIAPEACRRAAERRFSAKVMTDRYLRLYKILACRRTIS